MNLEELLGLLKTNECFVLVEGGHDGMVELTGKGVAIWVRLGSDAQRNCLAEGEAIGTELTDTLVKAVDSMAKFAKERIEYLEERVRQAQEVSKRCERLCECVRG